MKKKLGFLMLTFMLIALAACGNDNAKGDPDTDLDELQSLDVELHVTEEADVDETVDMEADVTYGDENVEDRKSVVVGKERRRGGEPGAGRKERGQEGRRTMSGRR